MIYMGFTLVSLGWFHPYLQKLFHLIYYWEGGTHLFFGGNPQAASGLNHCFLVRRFDKTLNPSEVDTSGGKKKVLFFSEKLF